MNLIEKVAYLKGLSEGLAVDENSAEGKLFAKIIEVLDDIACDIEEVYDVQDEIQAEIDEIDEDLAEVEEFLFGEEEEEEDFDCVDFECPNCGEKICLDADLLEIDEDDTITCPACGEKIELDLDFECDCDDCHCDDDGCDCE